MVSAGREGHAMTVALVGGGAFTAACQPIDSELLKRAGTTEVMVLPTAAAYEHPDAMVERASAYFADLGATVTSRRVLRRAEAEEADHAAAVEVARFVYLAGGSPMHLRSVLKDTRLWKAIEAVLANGGVVAAASAAATVVTDPMTDPRGGAFTLGLGLIASLAVVPDHETWSPERSRRTREIAPKGICVANIDSAAALVKGLAGWERLGTGGITIFLDGHEVGLDRLPV
jgi:cyanophycinase